MNHALVVVEKNIRSVTVSMTNFGFMKAFFIVLICFIGIQSSFAQRGNVEVIGDAELEVLLDKKVSGVDTTDLWGYRIQIYFGSNRKAAKEKEMSFKSKYPELASEVYPDYFQPNWRVRVGNYYRKIDAQKLMNKLEREFGDVFLVRDIIEMPAVH